MNEKLSVPLMAGRRPAVFGAVHSNHCSRMPPSRRPRDLAHTRGKSRKRGTFFPLRFLWLSRDHKRDLHPSSPSLCLPVFIVPSNPQVAAGHNSCQDLFRDFLPVPRPASVGQSTPPKNGNHPTSASLLPGVLPTLLGSLGVVEPSRSLSYIGDTKAYTYYSSTKHQMGYT